MINGDLEFLLIILGYFDLITLFLIIGYYYIYSKNRATKEGFERFLYWEVFPFILIQVISLIIFFVIGRS
jgi:hypothetical protein